MFSLFHLLGSKACLFSECSSEDCQCHIVIGEALFIRMSIFLPNVDMLGDTRFNRVKTFFTDNLPVIHSQSLFENELLGNVKALSACMGETFTILIGILT